MKSCIFSREFGWSLIIWSYCLAFFLFTNSINNILQSQSNAHSAIFPYPRLPSIASKTRR